MDEPLRGSLRPTRHRGLTSPDPVTAPLQPQRPPGSPPASIPGKDLWTSRRNVSGKKATPATTIKTTSVSCARQNAVTQFERWIEAKRPH
jgi:hypothetical protein